MVWKDEIDGPARSHRPGLGQGRASESRAESKPAAGVTEPPNVSGALKETPAAELKYAALLHTLSDWLFVLRKDGLILELQVPPHSEIPPPSQGCVGKRVMELLPVELGRQATYYLEKTLRTGQSQHFTIPYLVGNRQHDFEVRVAVCGPGEVLALIRDVTNRKLMEKEILEISNREQMRIGQDLHDGLGQHLTGITFLARALETKLTARQLPEAAEAAEIGKLVLQALSQTRNLARGLFPVELESTGLVPALKDLTTSVEKTFNISCQFAGDETVDVRNRTLAHHLFRIAQEAISNSVRHGQAQQVTVSLEPLEDKLALTVRDNGVGLPAGRRDAKGLGLRIMNYRAQKIGASLDIHPAEKGGTVMTCTFDHSTTRP